VVMIPVKLFLRGMCSQYTAEMTLSISEAERQYDRVVISHIER